MKILKPQDIYVAPTISNDDWTSLPSEALAEIFNISPQRIDYDKVGKDNSRRLHVHTKVRGEETNTRVLTLNFDGHNFGVVFLKQEDEDENDEVKLFITDEGLFSAATEYAQSFLTPVVFTPAYTALSESQEHAPLSECIDSFLIFDGDKLRLANPYAFIQRPGPDENEMENVIHIMDDKKYLDSISVQPGELSSASESADVSQLFLDAVRVPDCDKLAVDMKTSDDFLKDFTLPTPSAFIYSRLCVVFRHEGRTYFLLFNSFMQSKEYMICHIGDEDVFIAFQKRNEQL